MASLDLECDTDFVNAVMASQPVCQAVKPNTDDDSMETDTCTNSNKKRQLSSDSSLDESKRKKAPSQRPDNSSEHQTQKSERQKHDRERQAPDSERQEKVLSGADSTPDGRTQELSSDLKYVMKWMKGEFDSMKSDLVGTIDRKVDRLETRLRDSMLVIVKEEVSSVRQEFNDRFDSMATKIEEKLTKSMQAKLETQLKKNRADIDREIDIKGIRGEISDVKKSFAEVVQQKKHIEHDIVIRGLAEDPNELSNPIRTLNKVNALLRDGLKLADIKVSACSRKLSRGDKPGVVIATLETLAQRQKLLEHKRKLKSTKNYSNVYIEEARPLETRINEANIRTVIKEMGKNESFTMTKNGKLVRRETREQRR